MRKCEKFNVKCPFCVEGAETQCVGNSKECDERRSKMMNTPKGCIYELDPRWKTWSECYGDFLEAMPNNVTEDPLFFEFYETSGVRKKIFVPYLIMMSCNEAFEQILKEEKYETMPLVKKLCRASLRKAQNLHGSVLRK